MKENKYLKVKINIPNKVLLYCASIEMFNLDKEHYLKEKMLLWDVYKELKKYIVNKAKLNYPSHKKKYEYISIIIKGDNSLSKKEYKILVKIKEAKHAEDQKNKYH